ncbi:MAG: pilus assembly protein PilM [Opitutales bacterium]
MRLPRVLGIDCGAAHVACAWLSKHRDSRLRLEQFAQEEFVVDPADGDRWFRAVTGALATIRARAKFPMRDCVVAVPGHLVLTKFVRTPAVDRDKRARIVQFEAAQNIPLPLAEVAWGHVEVADDGADLDLMLAAVKLGAMEALVAAVEGAGFRVARAEPASLALRWAFSCNYSGDTPPTLVIDVGGRSTHLLFAAGAGFFLRTLPLAGDTITQAMAEELHVNFATAEKLKLQWCGATTIPGPDLVAHAAGTRAVAEFVKRLELELTRSRLGYGRQPGAVPPSRILLTGAGSRVPGLADALGGRLGLPTHRYESVQQLKLGSRMAGGIIDPDRLAVLVGLAVSWFQPGEAKLDLLPTARRENRVRRRQVTWWGAAAVLGLATLGPPILYYRAQTAQLEAHTQIIERELAPLHRLESANAAKLERLQAVQREIAGLERLAAGRSDWLAWLADLQSRFAEVGDVWLDRMSLSPPAATVGRPGTEQDPLRLELRGRLLDTENPLAKASADSFARMKSLFVLLGQSPFVTAVEGERFDNRLPGILQFEVTLVLNSQRAL